MMIDCAACPARNRACADCMMQVLFAPSTRDFGPDDQLTGVDHEMSEALDALVAAALIAPAAARAARNGIATGQRSSGEFSGQYLRAV
ncbi:hypothetical protein ACJMNC_11395 [Gordonia sp. VNK21]